MLRRADSWSPSLLVYVGAYGGDSIDYQREPTRSCEGARICELEAGGLKALTNESLKVLSGARLHARGDLFA
jgi:hypothetical protein